MRRRGANFKMFAPCQMFYTGPSAIQPSSCVAPLVCAPQLIVQPVVVILVIFIVQSSASADALGFGVYQFTVGGDLKALPKLTVLEPPSLY